MERRNRRKRVKDDSEGRERNYIRNAKCRGINHVIEFMIAEDFFERRALSRKTPHLKPYIVRKRKGPERKFSAHDAKRRSGQETDEVKVREKSCNILTSKPGCVVDAECRCGGVIESTVGQYDAKEILKDFEVVLVAVFDVECKFSG